MRPSCVPSSALLPGRGPGLRCGLALRRARLLGAGLLRAGLGRAGPGRPALPGRDAGYLHLGVPLAVTQPAPVTGLVPVVNHVDLWAGDGAHDLGGDLVAAQLSGIADDLAVVDDEHGGQRHAGADLTSERVDGEDVVHRRFLLPATAAHDRVHEALSFTFAGPWRRPAAADRSKRGSPACSQILGALPRIRPALALQVIRRRPPPTSELVPARHRPRPRPCPPCCPAGPVPWWPRGGGAALRTPAPLPRRLADPPPCPGP